MSSSRANAAARQRRAGDTQTTPQQTSYNSTGAKTRFVQQAQEPPQPYGRFAKTNYPDALSFPNGEYSATTGKYK